MTRFCSFLLLIVAIGLSGCYTNLNKNLDREVHVFICGTAPISIQNTGNSNFTDTYNHEEVQKAYMESLKNELLNNQIILVGNKEMAEFTINFENLRIEESTSLETVDDTTSEQHGKSYNLTSLELEVNGKVHTTDTDKNVTWSASKDKSEKLKKTGTISEILFGDNKQHNVYKEKELDDSEVLDLSKTLGRRSATVIEKEIYKLIN